MQSEESDELSPPPWLTTEPDKGGCFEALGLPRRLLSRRVYRGAVKKQKRYSALKLPIAVDSQTAMFAYIDPGNETASGFVSGGRGTRVRRSPVTGSQRQFLSIPGRHPATSLSLSIFTTLPVVPVPERLSQE